MVQNHGVVGDFRAGGAVTRSLGVSGTAKEAVSVLQINTQMQCAVLLRHPVATPAALCVL